MSPLEADHLVPNLETNSDGLEVLLHADQHDVVVAGVGDGQQLFVFGAYVLVENLCLLEGDYLVPLAVDYQDGHGDGANPLQGRFLELLQTGK